MVSKTLVVLLAVAAAPLFAADKSTAARRVYDMVLTQGGKPAVNPPGVDWSDRKVRFMQAPNDLDVAVYVTADEGKPECYVEANSRRGKIAEAAKMGLEVPSSVHDKGCSGLKRGISARKYETVDTAQPRAAKIKFKSEAVKLLHGAVVDKPVQLDQRQLDIFFGLLEDCLKNGV